MNENKRLTNANLAEIKERADAATEGPWQWYKFDGNYTKWDTEMPSLVSASDKCVMHFGDCERYYPSEGEPPTDEDAIFIANARKDIPILIDEVERLTAENLRYRDALERIANGETDSAGNTILVAEEALRNE